MLNKKPANQNIGLDRDSRVINRWRSEHPDICELYQVDAVAYLKEFNFQGRELIYADPPYIPDTRRRSKIYRHDYTCEDHLRLLRLLARLPCNVMISGYDSELYNNELSGWRKVSFTAKTHTDIRNEFVWMNFPVPEKLHDTRFLGETFRERQTIQRRQARLRNRIDRLSAEERHDLLQWMQNNYGTHEEVA